MSYSLKSLKGVMQGMRQGSIIGVIKGDTRRLDYSPYRVFIGTIFPYSLPRSNK